MNRIALSSFFLLLGASILFAYNDNSNGLGLDDPFVDILDAVQSDTLPDIKEREGDFITDPSSNPFDLQDPNVITHEVQYDAETGMYIVTEKIGDEYYRPPTYMTFDEYMKYSSAKQEKDYFDRLIRDNQGGSGGSGKPDPVEAIKLSDKYSRKLFGAGKIGIDVQGNVNLKLGADYQRVENPQIPERQRTQGGFDFDMNIQANVTGKIGDKMKLGMSYNTQATFNFENQTKLEYTGGEDDIIQKIEAGNVSLPLKSSLIQGSQSLLGLKTELQFGKLTLTGIASQKKSKRNQIQLQGGSQVQNFDVSVDNYDENRHFFFSHFNRDNFEGALKNLPQINSLFKVNRLEVWVTNTRNQTENVRDIVALSDLGEGKSANIANTNPSFQPPIVAPAVDIYGNPLPTNVSNGMYEIISNDAQARSIEGSVSRLQSFYNLQQSRDFEKVSARLLSPNEYTFHPELGFISLNTVLQPEHVLGVAIEFTYNGEVYKLGEFTNDVPIDPENLNVLYVKMMKSTTPRVDVPLWDLMMKNIYSLGAFQIDQNDFLLDVFYEDPGGGEKRFLPATALASKPLLEVLNLDRLNGTLDPQQDGRFDFIEGVTINSRNGRIMFPRLEPFGESLKKSILAASDNPTNPSVIAQADQYVYSQLYDSTIVVAREYPEFNRYKIRGSYRSSVSSSISLGAFNIPRGSVVVRAGGQTLRENIDYTVDYNIGQVTILNEAYVNSGIPINVSFEDNTLFGFQTKTMLGLRADYKVSNDFNIGATAMKLFERPFTEKVNIGEDPINNNIYGADIQYTTEAPWLTRAVDKIPLINTKAPSQISFSAEGAYLDPGHAGAISQDKEGVVYVDDFEGSTSSLDLRSPANIWTLASVPQGDPSGNNNLFPESQLVDTTLSGVNRAKLSWYQIDYSSGGNRFNDNPYTEKVFIQDLFPNTSLDANAQFSSLIRTLDLTYYPRHRGPYNFDLPGGGTPYSAGLGVSGELLEPETRWAGIQRELTTNNFEAANVEYVEFWVLSPFMNDQNGEPSSVEDGEMYINLGSVSEDVLRDSRLSFENGLPGVESQVNTDQTSWSRVSRSRAVTRSFDNNPENRKLQDVGLDGMNDEGEKQLYSSYVEAITNGTLANAAKEAILADPANDNFVYYNNPKFSDKSSVFEMYYHYNNPEGNSEEAGQQVNSATNIPDTEDINKDNTLNETEAYFQYKIPIQRVSPTSQEMKLNKYIVEKSETSKGRIWYRVKVPVEQYTSKIGGIQDFRSIRFIRLFLTKFKRQTTLRFARFELVRNQWRKYKRSLEESGVGSVDNEGDGTIFDVNAVNIEENSAREPYRYVLPPGIKRERQVGSYSSTAVQNEQSLSMDICNLKDGAARGIYKNINRDIRLFKQLKMFVHAEAVNDNIDKDDLRLFIRVGSDFEKNYYEYEMPLHMTEGNLTGLSDTEYAKAIWPDSNELSIKLDLFQKVKTERNVQNASLSTLYTMDDPENPAKKVGVKGNPNLGLAKSIMVGVRNVEDDGIPRCVSVWLNELRLSGFDEQGGWGAVARLDVQMADFATFNASTNYTSIGFGGLEQKLEQRSREEVLQYDLATNVELGKFLPEKSGIKIPVYAQYSNTTKSPKYDPYDLDVELKDKIRAANTTEEKDEIKRRAQDVTKIRSVNFTNVRKERTNKDKTPMPWDVENLSFTYAYSDTERRTPLIANDNLKDHQGIIDYTYSRKANYITPFKNVIKNPEAAKYFKFITGFNFNPLPNAFSFSTRMHRQYQSTTYRFSDASLSTYYDKKFTWDRSYDLKWDLSKSLKMTFNAVNNTVIDEPNGAVTKVARDTIWNNIRNWGRNKGYQHTVNVNYNVPLKNFPYLDFVKVKAQYNANYGWQAAALNLIGEDGKNLGNMIRNGSSRQINGDLNFVTLYNKSKYLQAINKGRKKKKQNRAALLNRGKKKDASSSTVDKVSKENKEPFAVARALLRPLMMIRRARLTYAEKYSSVVPGFMPEHQLLGLAKGFKAPGWDYALGLRQPDEAWLLKNQDWITESIFLNQQVLGTKEKSLSAKVSIEPFSDFKIDLDVDKKETRRESSYFKKVEANSPYDQLARREIGSFKISYFTLGTMFKKNYFETFKAFEANREIISKRLATQAGNTDAHSSDAQYGGYYKGYGRYQLDVLIPAFLSAYKGESANSTKLNVFKTLPLPNWKLTYKGLHKIGGLKKIFTSIGITHSYKSGLNINSFNSDADRDDESPFKVNPNTENYYSTFEIPNLVISEKLSPLIGLDVRLKNNMTAKIDWKKSRNLAMSFTDYQLSETRSEEFVVGLGYRMKNVYIAFLDFGDFTNPIKKKKKKAKKKGKKGGKIKRGNDMVFKLDFSWRDDVTVNHLLDQGQSIPTRGMKTIRLSPSIDYKVNKQLNLRLFYDYSRTIPATSASFPITNTSAGLQIRFSFN